MVKNKLGVVKDQSKFHLVKKKKSKIHGFGVFSSKKISKNTKIVQYVGEKINLKEMRRRETLHEKRGELWLFEINRYWYIDADVKGGIAKFVNHDNKPNCWIYIKNGEIWYRAAKSLKPNTELTVDYGTPLPKKPTKKKK